MTTLHPVHTVCPHCKRAVIPLPEQRRARCAEHGIVTPMRSAIVNPPLNPTPPARAA